MQNSPTTHKLGCFGQIIQEIFDLLVSIILFIIFYFSVLILLVFIGDNSESIRVLSFFGLFVTLVSLALFMWALGFQNELRTKEYQSVQLYDSTKSVFKYIFSFQVFFLNYWKRKIYSLSGLLISATALFTGILLEIGSGDFVSHFDPLNWKPSIIIFSILPFFIGVLADWLKRRESEILKPNFAARLVMYLGILKFYPTIILFLTGLVGGKSSFIPANKLNDILSLEIFLFKWIPDSYNSSASNQLYDSLGSIWFSLLYVLIPLYVFFDTRKSWRKYKADDVYNDSGTPISVIRIAYYISLLILIIPLYVAFNEGLIHNIILYFVELLSGAET